MLSAFRRETGYRWTNEHQFLVEVNMMRFEYRAQKTVKTTSQKCNLFIYLLRNNKLYKSVIKPFIIQLMHNI